MNIARMITINLPTIDILKGDVALEYDGVYRWLPERRELETEDPDDVETAEKVSLLLNLMDSEK